MDRQTEEGRIWALRAKRIRKTKKQILNNAGYDIYSHTENVKLQTIVFDGKDGEYERAI